MPNTLLIAEDKLAQHLLLSFLFSENMGTKKEGRYFPPKRVGGRGVVISTQIVLSTYRAKFNKYATHTPQITRVVPSKTWNR